MQSVQYSGIVSYVCRAETQSCFGAQEIMHVHGSKKSRMSNKNIVHDNSGYCILLYEKCVVFVASQRVQKNDRCMELDTDCSPPFHPYCHASRDRQFSHIGRY